MTARRWRSNTRRTRTASASRTAGGDELVAAWYPLRPWSEAPEVLRELRSRGCELALLSNGDRAMLEAIAGELPVQLDHIFSTGGLGHLQARSGGLRPAGPRARHCPRGLSACRRRRQRCHRREIGRHRLLLEQPDGRPGVAAPNSPPTPGGRTFAACWIWCEKAFGFRLPVWWRSWNGRCGRRANPVAPAGEACPGLHSPRAGMGGCPFQFRIA